jgi:hypothetical protein
MGRRPSMGELFPVLAGVFAATVALRISNRAWRAAWIAAVSVTFGVLATVVNGEEWFLIPVDTALVAISAGVVVGAFRLRSRLTRKTPALLPTNQAHDR